MTIFEINKAAKEYFKACATLDDQTEWKLERLRFLDKTFDLFQHVVTKEDLIFCEKKPKEDDYVVVTGYDYLQDIASEKYFDEHYKKDL